MKVVLDTNTVISGLFWKGAPRQIIDLARNGLMPLVTSPDLLTELTYVLSRDKFTERLALAYVVPDELVYGYAALASGDYRFKVIAYNSYGASNYSAFMNFSVP